MHDAGAETHPRPGAAVDESLPPAWPTSALVRVAALAARVLDVRACVVIVGAPGAPTDAPRIAVERGGAAVEVPPGRRVRLSADVPMITARGTTLGRLGTMDRPGRSLTADELATLRDFGGILADQLDLDGEARGERAANREQIDLELQGARDVATVAAAVRSFSALEDPGSVRRAIGEIALQLTGADSAAILDVVGDEMHLVQSSSAGRAWPLADTPLSDEAAPAVAAYTAGKALLLLDPDDPGERRVGDQAGPSPAFTLWQPFAAGGRSSVALLGLAWNGPLTIEPPRLTDLTELITTEATNVLERADLLSQLAGLARTDELTRLPNRRAIDEDLGREMERAKRHGTAVCVALLDLDRFKRFNDTHGHPAGDALLVEVAASWRDALRAGSDSLGRYGGEEFLAVLPAPQDQALATVERLLELTPQRQTASAGIASWDGAESARDLVARADVALYAAKAGGRNRCVVAAAPVPGRPPGRRLVGVLRPEGEALADDDDAARSPAPPLDPGPRRSR